MDSEGSIPGVGNLRELDEKSKMFMNRELSLKPDSAKERRCMRCSQAFISIQRICPPCKIINSQFGVWNNE